MKERERERERVVWVCMDDDGVEKSKDWMGVLPNDDGGGILFTSLVFYYLFDFCLLLCTHTHTHARETIVTWLLSENIYIYPFPSLSNVGVFHCVCVCVGLFR